MWHKQLAIAVLFAHAASCTVLGDEIARSDLAAVTIKSPEHARSLPSGTTSVDVDCYKVSQASKERLARFRSVMAALADNPEIRHLKLRIPNSSEFKDDGLEVLREFKSLESLELVDARAAWGGSSLHEQIAAVMTLKRVKLSFI